MRRSILVGLLVLSPSMAHAGILSGDDNSVTTTTVQEQEINARNDMHLETQVDAPDVKGMGKELARRASGAPEARGMTTGSDSTVCGAVGGASVQTGVFGGGISSESFACLAHKHSLYQAGNYGNFDLAVENVSWYFPPFLIVRMVRSAVFN